MDIMAKLRTGFRKSSREKSAAILELARAMADGKVPDQARLESALIASGETFADFEKMVETIREVARLERETASLDMAVEECALVAQAVNDHRAETNEMIRVRHRESQKLLAAKNEAQRVAGNLQKAAARLSTLRREHPSLLGEQPPNYDNFTLVASSSSSGTVISIADQSAPTLYVDSATLQTQQHRRMTLLQRAFAVAKSAHESAMTHWLNEFHELSARGDWREARRLPQPELHTPVWAEIVKAS